MSATSIERTNHVAEDKGLRSWYPQWKTWCALEGNSIGCLAFGL